MINVTNTKMRFMGLKKISDKLTVGTAYSFSKVKDKDEYKPTFIDCKIVGKALKFCKDNKIKERDPIVVTKAVIEQETFTSNGKNHSRFKMTIFEVEPPKENPQQNNNDDGDQPF